MKRQRAINAPFSTRRALGEGRRVNVRNWQGKLETADPKCSLVGRKTELMWEEEQHPLKRAVRKPVSLG